MSLLGGWSKLYDSSWWHDKFDDVSLEGRGLWVMGQAFCSDRKTDGQITTRQLSQMLSGVRCDSEISHIGQELVNAKLWRETDAGFVIINYKKAQSTKKEIQERKDADTERKRRSRATNVRDLSGRTSGVTPNGIRVSDTDTDTDTYKHPPSSSGVKGFPQAEEEQDFSDRVIETAQLMASSRVKDRAYVDDPTAWASKTADNILKDPLQADRITRLLSGEFNYEGKPLTPKWCAIHLEGEGLRLEPAS